MKELDVELKNRIRELEGLTNSLYESNSDRIGYGEELVQIGKTHNLPKVEASGWFCLGVYYMSTLTDYHKFKDCMKQVIELLKNETDLESYGYLTGAYVYLGVDAIANSQTNSNIEYFLIARHYAEMAQNVDNISLVDYFLCGFYIMINDIETATKYAKHSVDILKETDTHFFAFGSDGIDFSNCMLGQCYVLNGQFDKAWECYQISVEEQKHYTPHYDCPNTALIYAFHIMALHVARHLEERNAKIEEYISLIRNHPPAPPSFLHMLSISSFLIEIGLADYAKQIIPFLIKTNETIKNTNFAQQIAALQIELAKMDGDCMATATAMEDYYHYSIENNKLLIESVRNNVQIRADMELVLRRMQEKESEAEIAKKSNEAKSTFLSNISHEIRTPLNAILGMDEIIMRETSEESIYKYASDIRTAGNTLLGLINDILDTSKLEAGKIDIIPVEYDISSVINDLSNMIRSRAEDKGLEFRLEVDKDIPYLLYGDEIRVKQCVLNILTNAVKYTKKGSVTLEITAREAKPEEIEVFNNINYKRADGAAFDAKKELSFDKESCPIILKFRVKDTGIGIKEEDMDKLFRRFQRIEEEKNRTIEGTGLGISIICP